MVHYIFHYQGTTFMIVFILATALIYFPMGVYFIGKPSGNYTYTTSVILGLVYALGIIAILLSGLNIDSYRYPLIVDFFILGALVIYLLVQLRRDKYPDTYINAQLLRVAYLVLISLIVLI